MWEWKKNLNFHKPIHSTIECKQNEKTIKKMFRMSKKNESTLWWKSIEYIEWAGTREILQREQNTNKKWKWKKWKQRLYTRLGNEWFWFTSFFSTLFLYRWNGIKRKNEKLLTNKNNELGQIFFSTLLSFVNINHSILHTKIKTKRMKWI